MNKKHIENQDIFPFQDATEAWFWFIQAQEARNEGARYGRLQTELLTPLIQRVFAILKRRGEIPDIELDGRTVVLDYRSPLAKSQSQADIQNILAWLNGKKFRGNCLLMVKKSCQRMF